MTTSTDREKESLSALMDGQAGELEVRRVLKSISD
ncbi:MAG: negative regulator of sigma E activity, partial [Porticoccus sp.]